jgi:calcium permeable stress-gated cation channel
MAADPESIGILYVLGIGLLVSLIAHAVFACLRPRFPQVYQFRRLLNRYRSYNDFNGARVGFPSKRPTTGPLGWLGPTLATPEDEVVRRVGLDAAMFIRFMRSQLKTFVILAVLCCAALWPTYATGPIKNLPATDPKYVSGLNILSLSNLQLKSSRIWVTLVVEYLVALVVLWFLYHDYAQYARYRREYRTAENPVNYSVVVYDIPQGMNTEVAIRQRFELMFPNQVAEVNIARSANKGLKAEKQLDAVIAQRERAEFLRSTAGIEPEHRPGCCGALMCWKKKVNSMEFYTAEKARLESEILAQGKDAPYSRSAIVTFTNKRAASLIAQANQGSTADEWIVERAGEPEAVHWPALHIPGYQAAWRATAVAVFVFLLTFFWIIPITFIIGLANIKSLAKLKPFSWLSKVETISPAVTGIIETFLPVILLSVFISLIPTFIRMAVSQQRLHSHQLVESKTRNYFYIFTIFGSFIFIVIGGSGLDHLKEVIDKPSLITSLLANGIPKRGIFFSSFVLVSALIPMALGLLNPGRVIVRWIMLKMAKTERQRRAAEEGGSVFPYFQCYGTCMMMSLLGICYTTLAPLVTLCVVVFYIAAYLTFKHNIIFTCHRKWDGGGWDYPGAFWGVLAGLMIKQVTMIGVLGIYEAAGQAILAIFPLLFTILFGVWCHHRFSRVSQHGSLTDQYPADAKSKAELDELPTRYHGLYRQPGLSLKPHQNLSGLEDPQDVYPEEDEDGVDSGVNVKSEHHDSEVGYVPDRTVDRPSST